MQSTATTVAEYLASLPPERSKTISAVRKVVRKNLPRGFVEVMNWGMITYEVPLKTYPDTYNGKPLMYAALASQKNHMAVYLMGIYAVPALRARFEKRYRATGKRYDVGGSCVRFRKLEDLPLELIAEVVGSTTLEQFLETVAGGSARSARAKAASKKKVVKKAAPKKRATPRRSGVKGRES